MDLPRRRGLGAWLRADAARVLGALGARPRAQHFDALALARQMSRPPQCHKVHFYIEIYIKKNV